MNDIYDWAVAFLTANPEEIFHAWEDPPEHYPREVRTAHCLFAYVTRDRESCDTVSGCMTQIRGADRHIYNEAEPPAVTKDILMDTRIPDDPRQIGVEHLQVFAEWQRKLDVIYGRPAPSMPTFPPEKSHDPAPQE